MSALDVLRNVDLLQHVVEQLRPHDLTRLAITSQSTSDVALDELWEVLPTTFFVLRLLPCIADVEGLYVSPWTLADVAWNDNMGSV